MKIFKDDSDEIEFEVDSSTYNYQKNIEVGENSYGDEGLNNYFIILTYISANHTKRYFKKKYLDRESLNEAFIKIEKKALNNFVDWEEVR